MNQRRQLVLGTGLFALLLPLSGITQNAVPGAPIGWISLADPGATLLDVRDGLRALGYVGAAEPRFELRVPQRDAQSIALAVDELRRLQVAMIIAIGPAAPLVHRAVAGRIPVVFAFSGEPVEGGMVQSFGRPGGNSTGVSFLALQLVGKRMELIQQIEPKVVRVAILANPQHPGVQAERRESLAAAERLGLQVAYVELGPAEGLEAALGRVHQQNCQGMVVFPDAGMVARAEAIAAFALKERILCVSGWARFAQAGCIASYGPNLRDAYRRIAYYVDRILKGAHPSTVPVELPSRIELVLNMKTARSLGLAMPQSLLLRADEVIQ